MAGRNPGTELGKRGPAGPGPGGRCGSPVRVGRCRRAEAGRRRPPAPRARPSLLPAARVPLKSRNRNSPTVSVGVLTLQEEHLG